MKGKMARQVWQGESWGLIVRSMTAPDGREVERGYIAHPGSVVLVPVRPGPQGIEVLMLHQFRPALDRQILELPAGTRSWGEEWLVCAQRELREETGYSAAEFISLGRIWPAPGLSDERMALFLARDLTPAPLPADFDEVIDVRPMPLDDLVAMAQDGRLQDGKSVIALTRAAVYLNAS